MVARKAMVISLSIAMAAGYELRESLIAKLPVPSECDLRMCASASWLVGDVISDYFQYDVGNNVTVVDEYPKQFLPGPPCKR